MVKTGLALVSRALASEALIPLSANGWGCYPSLVIFWPEATQPLGLGLYGQVNGDLQEGLCKGDLSRRLTLPGSFVLVPCGVTASFLWVLVHARLYPCSSFKTGVSFPQVQWKSYNQILWIDSQIHSQIPWDSQSLCQSPRMGSLM